MRWRRFITLGGLAACLVVWPLAARAQRTGKVPRIGVLVGNEEKIMSDALRQGLSQLGYVDGKTISLLSGHAAVTENAHCLSGLMNVATWLVSQADLLAVDWEAA